MTDVPDVRGGEKSAEVHDGDAVYAAPAVTQRPEASGAPCVCGCDQKAGAGAGAGPAAV